MSTALKKKTLVVIGGGAAGFFCAVNAARMNRALQVTILEKTDKLLSKVKISGGGRCNLTHASDDRDEMSQGYPRGARFIKKAFHHFFVDDTIRWFKERGVALKTEPDGRIFPVTDSSQTVVDCLLQEAGRYGVVIRTRSEVQHVGRVGGKFLVALKDGSTIEADMVCIACGGFPKAPMFDWMRALGLEVESPVPSLFTFNMPGHPVTRLTGIAVPDAIVSIVGTKISARGPLLITHWGMSGPAVLRLSAWAATVLAGGVGAEPEPYHFSIRVRWLPGLGEPGIRDQLEAQRMEHGSGKIFTYCPFGLPLRLWHFLLEQSRIGEQRRWAELTSAERQSLIHDLLGQEFPVRGKTTFREEFVTAGGIRLSEIDPATMECRKIPGLFVAGEVMDVDGITGGYNFQHAWTSGFIAAKSAASCE